MTKMLLTALSRLFLLPYTEPLLMSDILLDNQAANTSAPSSGKGYIWLDSTTKKMIHTDDSGVHHGTLSSNYSASGVASQAITANTNTYITSSGILIPAVGLQVGQILRWFINAVKTSGAGVSVPVFTILFGTNQSTADTTRLTLTASAQVATASGGIIEIFAQVRTASASGVIVGNMNLPPNMGSPQNGLTTVSSSFDNTSTIGGQYAGIQINTGATGTIAWTIDSVRAELIG